jgi:hypothetical protein
MMQSRTGAFHAVLYARNGAFAVTKSDAPLFAVRALLSVVFRLDCDTARTGGPSGGLLRTV